MQGILKLDIVSGSGAGHETPVFEALSERSNYRRDSGSTVTGPPSCASVSLRRRLAEHQQRVIHFAVSFPIKHETFNWCWCNVAPTLNQHGFKDSYLLSYPRHFISTKINPKNTCMPTSTCHMSLFCFQCHHPHVEINMNTYYVIFVVLFSCETKLFIEHKYFWKLISFWTINNNAMIKNNIWYKIDIMLAA